MKGDFGKFIKANREIKSKSLKEIASQLKISQTYLFDIEHGKRNPSNIEMLKKIKDIYALEDSEFAYMCNLAAEETKTCPSDILDAVYKLDEDKRIKIWNEIRRLLKSWRTL